MICWVYVLRGRNGRNYVGITDRLQARIKEHNQGRTRADAGRAPFKLIYKEAHPDYDTARLRERFLKSGAGRQWLRETLTKMSETDEKP